MVNNVIFEGIVSKVWMYSDDLFARVASYRDMDLPQKKDAEMSKGNGQSNGSENSSGRGIPDFVTVRFQKSLLNRPLSVNVGDRIRVTGYLQSRDYKESMRSFLKDAYPAPKLPETLNPNEIHASRSMVEIMAQRVVYLIKSEPEKTAVSSQSEPSTNTIEAEKSTDPVPTATAPAPAPKKVKEARGEKTAKKK